MASVALGSLGTVVIHGDGQEIPITFRVSHDGHCSVSAVRLSSRFQLLEGSVYVDEEVRDSESGVVTHTIGQDATTTDEGKSWLLKCGTYRVYGVRDSLHSSSAQILGSNVSTTSNQQPTVPRKIKVEPGCETIHILSDDSDSDTQLLNHVSTPSFVNLDSTVLSEDNQPLCTKPPSYHLGLLRPLL